MGRKSDKANDWDDELLDGDDLETELVVATAPASGSGSRLTWRLIEQAREARALREQLADFNDYA